MTLLPNIIAPVQSAKNPWRKGGIYFRGKLVPWIVEGYAGLRPAQKKAATHFAGVAHGCLEPDEELKKRSELGLKWDIPDVAACVKTKIKVGEGIHGGIPYIERVKRRRLAKSVTGAF